MKFDPAMRDQCNVKRRSDFRHRILPVLIAACFCGDAVLANPVGPQVANGQVSFLTQGNLLSITNSPGSIINWQNFSINPSEITRFLQQNSSSSVLNRIIGQDPSQILGALQSNGRVFLINPNGILFGQGAQVDVNGLVASTLNISNADFLSGKHNFSAGDKASGIKNQGAITTPSGGQVYLIAPNIENSGIITSPKGEVVLAAGHSVQLVDSANPDMHVVVSAPDNQALNLGQIVAHSGKVGIYGALINQRGIVNADSAVVGENGKIVFKASKDTLLEAGSRTSATGAGKGGDIHVLGERVGLTGDAKVDASGEAGGGTVLVGGDYRGGNPDVQNASFTYLGKNVKIKADAVDSGDGGKIIVWANDTTKVYGDISARGGQQSGNGGFVETSGKRVLSAIGGRVDASAPNGLPGTWLLDPENITIANTVDLNGAFDSGSPNLFTPTGTPAIASVSTINTSLSSGTNVTITTLGTTTHPTVLGTDLGDITVSDAIARTGASATAATLTLDAAHDIIVNNTITNSNTTTGGKLDVTLLAGNKIDLTNASSSISVAPAGGTAGTVKLVAGAGGIDNNNHNSTIIADKLEVNSAGNVILGGLNNVSTLAASVTGGTNTFGFENDTNALALGSVGSTTGVTATGDIVIRQYSAGNIVATQNVTSSAGDVLLGVASGTGAVAVATGKIVSGKNVQLYTDAANGGTITLDGGLTASSSGSVSVTSGQGAIALSGAINSNNSGVTLIAATGINLFAPGQINAGNGNVSLASGGVDTTISLAAGTQINGGSGTMALTADHMSLLGEINSGSGAVTLSPTTTTALVKLGNGATDAAGTLGLSDTELATIATTGGGLTIGDSLVVRSGSMEVLGTLNLTSPAKLTGPFTLKASNGDILVNGPVTAPAGIFPYTTGTLTNSSALSSTNVGLTAGKMTLAGGSIVATGHVDLFGGSNDIHLGTVATDLTATTLELSNAELNTITTPILRIGTLSGGPIDIKSALTSASGGAFEHVSSGLSLLSGSTITQQAGATIAVPALAVKGTAVTLLEANPVGVIAGAATDGAFQYRSANLVTVSAVDTFTGISATGNIYLESDSTAGINQTSPISTTGGLALKTIGPVSLPNPTNAVGSVAADLNLTGSGSGAFFLYDSIPLTVGSVLGLNGISTNNQNIGISSGITSALTVNQAISAGTAKVGLETDSLTLGAGGTVTAADVNIRPDTAGRPITVGGACIGGLGTCLTLTSLYKISASTIGIGTENAADAPGAIYVAGITSGTSLATDFNPITTRIGLLSGAGVTQGGTITVQDLGIASGGTVNLPMANTVTNLAGMSSGNFTFANSQLMNVTSLSGGVAPHNYSVTGITTASGAVSLTTNSGNLNLLAPVSAGGGVCSVDLTASAGAIVAGGGTVIGSSLNASASGGIGSSTTPLLTQVSALTASNSGANTDIAITNTGTLTVNNVSQPGTSTGNIIINNFGAMTVAGPVSTDAGGITLIAHSPLTVNGSIASSSGNITLTAGATGSAGAGDILTVNAGGFVSTNSGNIALNAGDSINIANPANVTSTSGTILKTASLNPAAAPPPPTVAQCTATPTLAGCTAVLPTLSDCTTTPTLAGCTAVLPTVSSCTTTPTLAGCTAVLPTLSDCTTTPTLAGCTAVLPTVSTCTTTPTLAGCTAVLPTVSSCTTTPTLAGCTAVLPTVSTCTTTPTLAGCTAVLPTVSTCTTTPTLAGCTAVLPTVSSCTTTPTLAGCTAVLPTLSSCTTTPTLAGCTVVLPTLSSCTTTPTLAGCSTVLPTLSTCTTTPTLSGCSAVLPTVSQCSSTPTLAGCTTVLPTTTTLTQTNAPVSQAINATVNTIVASTITVSNTTSSPTTTTTLTTQGGGTGAGSSSAKDDKASDSKKDEKKKDEKKDTAGVDKPGAKKDDAAKKMYCN